VRREGKKQLLNSKSNPKIGGVNRREVKNFQEGKGTGDRTTGKHRSLFELWQGRTALRGKRIGAGGSSKSREMKGEKLGRGGRKEQFVKKKSNLLILPRKLRKRTCKMSEEQPLVGHLPGEAKAKGKWWRSAFRIRMK